MIVASKTNIHHEHQCGHELELATPHRSDHRPICREPIDVRLAGMIEFLNLEIGVA